MAQFLILILVVFSQSTFAGFVTQPLPGGGSPGSGNPNDPLPPPSPTDPGTPTPPPSGGGQPDDPVKPPGGPDVEEPTPNKPGEPTGEVPGEEWIPAGASRCKVTNKEALECGESYSRYVQKPATGLHFQGLEAYELFELFHGLMVPEAVIHPEILKVNNKYIDPTGSFFARCTMYYFPVLQRSPAFYCNFIYNKDLVQMDGKLMWLKITDPLRVNLLRGRLMGLPGAQVQEGWYHARSNYSTKKQKQNGPLLSVPNWTLSCSATTNEVCYLHLNGSTDQIYSIPPQ